MIAPEKFCINAISNLPLGVKTPIVKPKLFLLWSRLSKRFAMSGFIACFTTYTMALYFLVNTHVYAGDESSPISTTEQRRPSTPEYSKEQQSDITSYSKELARLDQKLEARKRFAATRPNSWLHLSSVAEAYFERARLSGEFKDYSTALRTLEKVFTMVGNDTGPVLLRARLNYSMHRLFLIEQDLLTAQSALLVNKPTNALIDGIRADVLLQQGQHADAKKLYEELDTRYPSSASAVRIAHAYVYVGDYEEAERWLAIADDRAPRRDVQLKSWVALQAGILDLERGQLDEALVHYEHALDLFPGYWLVEEHIAEIDALQGRTNKAKFAYRNLIKRTGSPLFMAALADLLEQGGESEINEADRLLERVDEIYNSMANQIPELIAGHALEQLLQRGNPMQALQLAKNNYQLRAGGPSAVLLAQAHAANGQLSEASAMLESLLTTQFRSADLHATADVVYRALGFTTRADRHQQLAMAINPNAVANSDWLLRKIKAVKTL